MIEEQNVARAYKTYQIVGLFLGPIVFAALYLSPAPPELSAAGWATAALALWMAIWWTTDAVPLFVTALLPLVFLPLLGVANIGTAAAPFADPVIFLLLGGFLLGLAVERWNLHRRIAFHIIRRVGTRPIGLLGGVMLATAAISMWISNTATTVMMLPIAISLIVAVLPPGRGHGPEGANFAAAMTLGVAYAASIGGMATLIGSPPNALAAGYLSQAFKIELDFGVWMAIALPIAGVMLGLAFLVLSRVAFPFPTLAAPDTQSAVDLLRQTERMSVPERRVAIVFAVVIACWILYPWVEAQIGRKIGDAVIAVAGAIALFLVPADWRSRTFLLDYATARKAPWDIFILFGGGLSLAQAMQNSGLAGWIGNGLSFLHGMPVIVLIAGVSLLLVFMTELISNTAATAAFLPVAGSLVIGGDAPPVLFAVTVALAASCGFMLPVGTVPNALVFGTGYIPLPKMVRAGFILDLLGAAVITAGIALAALLVI
jgi:solute carrier family 13 (sodium-dependent dicarboxylate transporter), member 2/3/5